MEQSLEELKAQNIADDKKIADEAKLKKDKAKSEEDLEIKPQETDGESESDDDDDDDNKTWMQTDEQTSDSDAKFTDGDVANVRRKLKGKLQKERDEKDVLAEENAALKAQLAQKPGNQNRPLAPAAPAKMPMLADFSYNETAYQSAMQKWVQQEAAVSHQNIDDKQAQSETLRQAHEKAEVELDKHYERAGKLVNKANIDPEVYKSADTAVRKAVDSVIPEGGDTITDGIIARLGEGSERVMYFLGRNASKRAEFVESLRNDRSGISAAIMLGQLKTTLSTQKNRDSNANSPGTQINGDGGGGANASKLKRQYEKGDVQTRINIKRAAKKSGVDVSGW